MDVWAAADLKGALGWLESQSSGQARDHAILGLFSGLKATDLARAVSLALSLENEDLRRSQTQLMFRHWRNSDPAAAQEWALHNGYDPPWSGL
jgi:hypothetical protein